MDKIGFAHLCCELQAVLGTKLGHWTIGDIAAIIDDAVEKTKQSSAPNTFIAEQLEIAISSSMQGRKIDAIKAFRQATGYGLKESKDAVERAIDSGKVLHPVY